MNKKIKWGIIISSVSLLVIIIGLLLYGHFSALKKARLEEAARLAFEQEVKAKEEEFNDFISKNDSFFPNSFLNDKDISGMTPSEVISSFENEFRNGKLIIHVEDGDVEESLSFEALNLNFESFDKYIADAYKSQKITQEEYFSSADRKDYRYDFLKDINMEAFEETDLHSFFSENVVSSQDAYAYVSPKTGEVSIIPEVYGNEISFDILEEKISQALSNGEYEITVSSADYIKPQVLSDDKNLINKKATLEDLAQKEISIKLCGESTTLSGSDLWKILDGSDDYVSNKGLDSYVASLKATYDSCYFKRPFTTSYGEEITLESGNYGWVINADKTKAALITAITSMNSTPSMEVQYTRYGQRPALHEFNDTYIEVSISGQHVWAYVNGECVLSDDIISGEVTTNDPETTTNRGVFRLSYKQLNAVLRGADYVEPVTYWMPFDGGIGFHDATWRDDSEFGGQTYMGNGSHGCINMRLGSAEILYGIINEEIPIIVW